MAAGRAEEGRPDLCYGTNNPAPTYSLRSSLRFLSINAETGAVAGTPPPGTTSFTYTVTAWNWVGTPAIAGPFTVYVSGNDSIALKLWIKAYRGRYIGTITIHDPSAGLSTTTSITGITRLTPGSVRSTEYGNGPYGSYGLTWTLVQRG